MLWLQCIILLILKHVCFSQNVEVSTPMGKIIGTRLNSRFNKTIYAFRGIRYAEAPIGELRFKPPVPVKKWDNAYNATTDGPVCPQPTEDPVSEDCLMLNVYTTKLPHTKCSNKRPVIIHLHAGGFYSATGRSNWAGPQYFMDQDIVLVTLNYRIGSLGFISVGKEAPGNNGLKDQVVAMKWVKKNIEAFGGDPNSITLYGYSAGAWSITLHMVSPMSKGLFHKAILGSGAALGIWSLPHNQLEIAKKQASFVGCPDNNPEDIIKCLRTKSAIDIGNTFFQFQEFGYDPILIWSPVIENDYGQERFLTEDPMTLILNGKFENVPVIAGITKDEFDMRAFPLLSNASLLEKINTNFDKYAPICFIYERDTPKSREVSENIKKFYLHNKPITNSSFSKVAKIYSDAIVGFPVNKAVELISEKSSQAVYYYEFTYQGRYSHYYLPETNKPYGVVHHDDLIYTFYISMLFPYFNSSYPEGEMVDKLTSLYASFAKTGTPRIPITSKGQKEILWTPYNVKTKTSLKIGNNFSLNKNFREDRYEFWRSLFTLSL